MGFLVICCLILMLSSCAKIHYLYQQGVGQFKLQNRSISNEKILLSNKISGANKEKIKKIEVYKNFFYDYFSHSQTAIYSKTTILEQKAVSYLVIASPYQKVEAKNECFPFMGCFPYLGFFQETSAKTYAKNLHKENYVTWIRPVYAYSTLGYFQDNILSSFFYFSDQSLAELIFHELFHTIFFAKNEVELNENLANYFAGQLVIEYFKFDDTAKKKYELSTIRAESINKFIKDSVDLLSLEYKKEKNISKLIAQRVLNRFLQDYFLPEGKKLCQKYLINSKKCFVTSRRWNNASFAAYLTYENRSKDIAQLGKKLDGSLKVFLNYIEKKYKDYKEEDNSEIAFSQYLFR